MAITIRIIAFLIGLSAAGFAGTWSGDLVDTKCYVSEEHNVNPGDTMTSVDRDLNFEMSYCAPGPRTKAFSVVDEAGRSFRLDAAGNAKAAALAHSTGKRHPFVVAVTGEVNKQTIQVDSISLAH